MARVYEEIANFIAAEISPDSLIAFQPSDAAKKRVEDLIRREKNEGLTPEETSELNHCMALEHILTLAKARARPQKCCASTMTNVAWNERSFRE